MFTPILNSAARGLRAIAVAAVAAFASAAGAQGDASPAKFLSDAIRGNIADVRMGELALQRGRSKEVRDFGETLVSDHTLGREKASALARTLGVAPPTETTAAAIKTYEAMSKLSGEDFDRAFAAHMRAAHEQEIAKYTEQTRSGASPEVAQLAREALPTLHEHLEQAQAIAESLEG